MKQFVMSLSLLLTVLGAVGVMIQPNDGALPEPKPITPTTTVIS